MVNWLKPLIKGWKNVPLFPASFLDFAAELLLLFVSSDEELEPELLFD